jgi:hypothetical protein
MAVGDNEITLVDEESAHHTVLLFSHDTIMTATLTDYATGKLVYSFKTNDDDSRTDFYSRRNENELDLHIGTLRSGLFRGRSVTRRGEKVKLSKWLSSSPKSVSQPSSGSLLVSN